MLGNFQYCNPTKLYFGEQSFTFLKEELQKYGPKVQLSYGRDSIKKNGIYDQVMELLKEAGKTVFEDPGVMPNPTVEKLYEGCKIARENEGEDRYVIMQRPSRYLHIVRKIHGKNIMRGWKR